MNGDNGEWLEYQKTDCNNNCYYGGIWYAQHTKPNELMHIPNGLISQASMRKVKSLGVRRGYPDLFMPIPKGSYHGLFLELKAPDIDVARGLSPDQKKVLKQLRDRGYMVATANCLSDATRVIIAYLGDKHETI